MALKAKILVVDDEPQMLQLLSEIMDQMGAEPHCVESGPQAAEQLHEPVLCGHRWECCCGLHDRCRHDPKHLLLRRDDLDDCRGWGGRGFVHLQRRWGYRPCPDD